MVSKTNQVQVFRDVDFKKETYGNTTWPIWPPSKPKLSRRLMGSTISPVQLSDTEDDDDKFVIPGSLKATPEESKDVKDEFDEIPVKTNRSRSWTTTLRPMAGHPKRRTSLSPRL